MKQILALKDANATDETCIIRYWENRWSKKQQLKMPQSTKMLTDAQRWNKAATDQHATVWGCKEFSNMQ